MVRWFEIQSAAPSTFLFRTALRSTKKTDIPSPPSLSGSSRILELMRQRVAKASILESPLPLPGACFFSLIVFRCRRRGLTCLTEVVHMQWTQ